MALSSLSATGLTRREFLAASAASAAALAAGCATNPVTGGRQLMLMSEGQEVDLDRKWAPHQFSADYGVSQDAAVNAYLGEVGNSLAALTHRPQMPYSFRMVNNAVVNGYTFPAGSTALARGMLLAMDNEAELAAVLGHELGHVNARHAAERMTKGLLTTAALVGVAEYVKREKEEYAGLAVGLGGIGANVLLSRYSRDDEREADALGMEYMTRAGYTPRGMVDLMDMFRTLRKDKPGAVELLFATHPLSDERYATARTRAETQYAEALEFPDRRERYLDRTATVRALRGAIEAMQAGQEAMQKKRYTEAEAHFLAALKAAPDDYAGLLMTAQCCLAQGRKREAAAYIERAKAVYPDEPLAQHLAGMTELEQGRYEAALAEFTAYAAALPGNPNTVFYRGVCLERMGRRREAAAAYAQYRRVAPSGEFGRYTAARLTQWGYMQSGR